VNEDNDNENDVSDSLASFSPFYPLRESKYGSRKAILMHKLANQLSWNYYEEAATKFNYPLAEVSLGIMLLQNQAPPLHMRTDKNADKNADDDDDTSGDGNNKASHNNNRDHHQSNKKHNKKQFKSMEEQTQLNALEAWKHFKRAENLLFKDINTTTTTTTSPSSGATWSQSPNSMKMMKKLDAEAIQQMFQEQYQLQQLEIRKQMVNGYDFNPVEVYHNLGFMLFYNLGQQQQQQQQEVSTSVEVHDDDDDDDDDSAAGSGHSQFHQFHYDVEKHEQQCKQSLPYLSKAARHVLWYAGASAVSEEAMQYISTASSSSRGSNVDKNKMVGQEEKQVDNHFHQGVEMVSGDVSLSSLTTLYGILQSALYSYDITLKQFNRDKNNQHRGVNNNNNHGSSSSFCYADGMFDDPMRRYEVSAMLGDIQSQLNLAFLFKQRSTLCQSSSSSSSSSLTVGEQNTGSWVHSSFESMAHYISHIYLNGFSMMTRNIRNSFNSFIQSFYSTMEETVDKVNKVDTKINNGDGGSGGGGGGGGGEVDTCQDIDFSLFHAPYAARVSESQEMQKWLLRSIQYYHQVSDLYQVPEAHRERGLCYLGLDDWFDTCRSFKQKNNNLDEEGTDDDDDDDDEEDVDVANILHQYNQKGLYYLELASDGNDLQALNTLANLYGDENKLRILLKDSSTSTSSSDSKRTEEKSERDSNIIFPVGSETIIAYREKSRDYYKKCSSVGRYPSGLPCQIEHAIMEITWLVKDFKRRIQ
jgi:hypothetical protein